MVGELKYALTAVKISRADRLIAKSRSPPNIIAVRCAGMAFNKYCTMM